MLTTRLPRPPLILMAVKFDMSFVSNEILRNAGQTKPRLCSASALFESDSTACVFRIMKHGLTI